MAAGNGDNGRGPWTPNQDEEWPGRVYEAMTDLAQSLLEFGAGSLSAKALGAHDRLIEVFNVVLLDDHILSATWVECASGLTLNAHSDVDHFGSEVPPT